MVARRSIGFFGVCSGCSHLRLERAISLKSALKNALRVLCGWGLFEAHFSIIQRSFQMATAKKQKIAAASVEQAMGMDGGGGVVNREDDQGVVLTEAENGVRTVKFDFDRQLMGMMDRVPGAVFNKESGAYQVPVASSDVLENVVNAMRKEKQNAAADLSAIKSLAFASGLQAQDANGVGSDVAPMVSTYREDGKFSAGEIVNANSRYVAQLSGFGSKDGAAFVTIHKLADLNRGNLMKGDYVGIQYDSKLFGTVSALSRSKSVAQLEADFASNMGKKVDGVTVTDRGDQVGVAFDFHPALVARIRKVEGAAFNAADQVWEVPKEKQEFALRAADDMRNEFVMDGKEAAALGGVAKSKMDNAKVWAAFTKDGQSSFGVVLAVGERYALQKGGRENFTLHHLSQLDQVPTVGRDYAVYYNKGVGAVVDQDLKREQNQARGAGR